MNGKIKSFTLITGIILFGLGIYLFTSPVESAEEKSKSLPEDKEEIRNLKEELTRYSDYFNLVEDKKILEEEILNIDFGWEQLLGGMYSPESVGSINLHQNGQSRQATMLEVDKEIHIWYIKLYQSVRNMNGLQDEIRVDGVDKEGNMVYSEVLCGEG